MERSARLGAKLSEALGVVVGRHRAYVRSQNGRGLFHSLHLRNPQTGEALSELTDEIVMKCLRRGVLMFLTGTRIPQNSSTAHDRSGCVI